MTNKFLIALSFHFTLKLEIYFAAFKNICIEIFL